MAGLHARFSCRNAAPAEMDPKDAALFPDYLNPDKVHRALCSIAADRAPQSRRALQRQPNNPVKEIRRQVPLCMHAGRSPSVLRLSLTFVGDAGVSPGFGSRSTL